MKKSPWLNKKINIAQLHTMKNLLREGRLHTVCEEARCPNIGECFENGVATFMILGDVCTRGCRFCGIKKGIPEGIDPGEPQRIREAVERLSLKHVVVTSPTRDDLDDGGAAVFARVIDVLRSSSGAERIEVLIPDFSGTQDALKTVVDAAPDIIAHNMETVPSFYSQVRGGADYHRSLEVLAAVKRMNRGIFTKSGLMLGLGEGIDEVERVLKDLREVDCDLLSIGQYLPPSRNHIACSYIPPEQFTYWQETAYAMGFKRVKSSPYVRSSYLAHEY